MFHKRRQVEITEDLLGADLDGLGNIASLFWRMCYLAHLRDQDLVGSRATPRPVKAGEYLGCTTGYKTGEILCKNLHTVLIDKLGVLARE